MTRPVLGSVIDTQQSVEQPENSLLATDRPGGGDGDQGQASQEHWRVLPEETGTKAQCGPPNIEIISEEFIVCFANSQGTQSPLLGAFLPFSGSLWHKDKWLHARKESIMGRPIIDSFSAWSHLSLCHKEPAKGKKAPSWGLWVP